jgi:hypothetical protein
MELVVEVRSLGRERKPVSYMVEEDLDGRSRREEERLGVEGSKTQVRVQSQSSRNTDFLL